MPKHDKTNKMTSAPSEDSDQPGHLSDLSLLWAHILLVLLRSGSFIVLLKNFT